MSVRQSQSRNAPLTVVRIEQVLEDRILCGALQVNARMPTVREYAEEFGVNKNTVARAFRALERKGYLEAVRGRGTFVRRNRPLVSALNSRWLKRLEELMSDAKKLALGPERVLLEVHRCIDRVFDSGELQVAFVECNRPDLEILGEQLQREVEYSFRGVLLDDLLARPEATSSRFDLIATTFVHLAEVSRALGEQAKHKVIGVHSMPTHDTLLKVARLNSTVIGLVCELPRVAEYLLHIVGAYHPSASLLPVLIGDSDRLRVLFTKADVLIVTQMCYERLMALQPPIPVIVLSMTIDRQSIDFLRERIASREKGGRVQDSRMRQPEVVA